MAAVNRTGTGTAGKLRLRCPGKNLPNPVLRAGQHHKQAILITAHCCFPDILGVSQLTELLTFKECFCCESKSVHAFILQLKDSQVKMSSSIALQFGPHFGFITAHRVSQLVLVHQSVYRGSQPSHPLIFPVFVPRPLFRPLAAHCLTYTVQSSFNI